MAGYLDEEGGVMPKRIQLSRRKGWRMPENTVKVSRPTVFGNPFKITDDRGPREVVMAFRTWLLVQGCDAGIAYEKAAILSALPSLRGKDLACWCKPGEPCHADVLIELANA